MLFFYLAAIIFVGAVGVDIYRAVKARTHSTRRKIDFLSISLSANAVSLILAILSSITAVQHGMAKGLGIMIGGNLIFIFMHTIAWGELANKLIAEKKRVD